MKGEQRVVGVGWDAAGWRGKKQAIAITRWKSGQRRFEWEADGCGVSKAFSLRDVGGLSLKALVSQVSKEAWTLISDTSVRVVLAIDAPLGFPASFVKFVGNPWPNEVPLQHAKNPLAFRATERFVMQEYRGILETRPLSPSLDLLSHAATVALSAVAGLREEGFQLLPQDKLAPRSAQVLPRREIVEVYPALAKVPRPRRKKGGKKPPPAPALPSLRVLLPDIQPTAGHRYDAALSAVMAVLFAAKGGVRTVPALVEPGKNCMDAFQEGWIFGFPPDFVRAELEGLCSEMGEVGSPATKNAGGRKRYHGFCR